MQNIPSPINKDKTHIIKTVKNISVYVYNFTIFTPLKNIKHRRPRKLNDKNLFSIVPTY
jgi:TATA-binding protein-associated factor Taf7